MRVLPIVAVIGLSALAGCSKKDSSDGLPPAEKWSDQAGPMEPKTPPKTAGGGAGFHGGGGGDQMPAGHPPVPGAGDGSGLPAGHPDTSGSGGGSMIPAPTPPRDLEKLADGRYALGPFSIALPADWSTKPVTSEMRAADFVLGDAELVVTYFGQNGAGSLQDNMDRWLGMITPTDGKAAKDVAKTETLKVAGQDATILVVAGRYTTEGMPGMGGPVDKADQELVAGIMPSPSGPFYLKLVGPKKTVDANLDKLRGMLTGAKVR